MQQRVPPAVNRRRREDGLKQESRGIGSPATLSDILTHEATPAEHISTTTTP
jgi:hypothetical protein